MLGIEGLGCLGRAGDTPHPARQRLRAANGGQDPSLARRSGCIPQIRHGPWGRRRPRGRGDGPGPSVGCGTTNQTLTASRESPAGRGRRVESAERGAQAPSPPPRPVGTKGARPHRAGESGGLGGVDRGARDGPGLSPAALQGSGGPLGSGRERWGRGTPPVAALGPLRLRSISPSQPGARR